MSISSERLMFHIMDKLSHNHQFQESYLRVDKMSKMDNLSFQLPLC